MASLMIDPSKVFKCFGPRLRLGRSRLLRIAEILPMKITNRWYSPHPRGTFRVNSDGRKGRMKTFLAALTLAACLYPCLASVAQSPAMLTLAESDARIALPGLSLAVMPLGGVRAPGDLAYSFVSSVAIPLCPPVQAPDRSLPDRSLPEAPDAVQGPCIPANPYKPFLDAPVRVPMTPRQKGYLAIRDVIDPGNLATIINTSAFTIGFNSHTAYGPGWGGFGLNVGDSLLQDATGEFFSTFVIASLTREDPHYYRMPHASIPRRFLHAVAHTVVSQHDNGAAMLNYDTLLTYPISAEISNLYVPGVRGNGPSTVERMLTGYATDPVDNLIAEFLPDVARRIHVRVIFVQGLLNQVGGDESSQP
jgi:hypothetical protein